MAVKELILKEETDINSVGLEIPLDCDTFEKLYDLSDWQHYKTRRMIWNHPLHTPDYQDTVLFITGGNIIALTYMGNRYAVSSDKSYWIRVDAHEFCHDGNLLDKEHVSSIRDIMDVLGEKSHFVLDTWVPLTDYPLQKDGFWKLEIDKCVEWKNYATIKLTYSFDTVSPIREWCGKCDNDSGEMIWAEVDLRSVSKSYSRT